MINLEQLHEAARVALTECLGVKQGEEVLVVVDDPLVELGEIFYETGQRLGLEILVIKMKSRENHGSEPPQTVARAMAKAQVVFCLTSKSLSHTRARQEACAGGTRVASLPAITGEMMGRALDVDYQAIANLSNKLARMLTTGRRVEITSSHGTDLEMSIVGRVGQADTGLLWEKGDFGNLPAGEAYIAPVEGTATGRLVIDGAMAGVGVLAEPLVMNVEKGAVVGVTGKDSGALEAIFARYGPAARQVAELGIGTNPKARLTGKVLEDEKVLGTVHLALGDNSAFGGNIWVASHLDGIITCPTVKIDGKLVLDKGVLLMVWGDGETGNR